MRGNIVVAAAVFGVAVVLASVILVLGVRAAAEDASGRIATAVEKHGGLTLRAGEQAGRPIDAGFARLSGTMEEHAAAVTAAGRTISTPRVKMEGAVPIVDQQPLRVEGTADDGASPPVGIKLEQQK